MHLGASTEARWSALSGNADEHENPGRHGADKVLVWLLAVATTCGFALIGSILFSLVQVALA